MVFLRPFLMNRVRGTAEDGREFKPAEAAIAFYFAKSSYDLGLTPCDAPAISAMKTITGLSLPAVAQSSLKTTRKPSRNKLVKTYIIHLL